MATEYYDTLCDRFEKLKLAFLPEEFSPTGEYEDIVYEHTRAYKVLTHAELEYYFEGGCESYCSKSIKRVAFFQSSIKAVVGTRCILSGCF